MKLFGWKSAGRADARPVLSRVFGAPWWTGHGGARLGDWPSAYEPQVRDGYIGNPVAQRAVRLVSESVGSAPLKCSDLTVADLVNARSGGQALLETVAMHMLLHGNAYVQVLSDPQGHPRELFALRPERVTVEADARGWPVAFLYRAGENVTRLPAEDARGRTAVVHVKAAHPLDDHYGLGCLGAAAGAIAIHNAATRWNKALLDNAARPSGALVYEPGDAGATLAREQFERLRAELEASFSGAGNAGRPLLLEGGLKWQALSLTPADMDFVGLKAAAAREIALAFGVPPMLLGLPGDATYANYREANRALWKLAVLPLAGTILASLRQALSPHFEGLTLDVDLDRLPALAEDRERLWAQVEAAGFLTLNEKRAMAGFDHALCKDGDGGQPIELKFNPWHDPDDGRFTYANSGTFHPGGGSFGGAGASGSWDGPVRPRKPNGNPAKPPVVVATKPKAAPPRARKGKVRQPSPAKAVSVGGYRFGADAADRPTRVSGELRLKPDQRRSHKLQREAGKPDRLDRDHGGHYVAREFGGPEIAFNHFAQDARINRGVYRRLEIKWKQELRRGRRASVDIRPTYAGRSKRPDALRVKYMVDGVEHRQTVPNPSGGK